MKKYLPIGGGIILVLLSGAGIIFLGKGGMYVSPNQPAALVSAVRADDWSRGKSGAAVTLVEYSDFQCPACAAYYPVVEKLIEDFGGDMRFVYRDFPLRQIHAHADLAARAAEAAGVQGKFWEMHALLFQHQQDWAEADNAEVIMTGYADSLHLNLGRFKTDLNSPDTAKRVEDDFQSGLSSKVSATPTFFLNGKKMENPRSYDKFKEVISQELGR